jgi:methyl-accepting chemotaxis protein
MKTRPVLGLRNQIIALAVVPLIFLILSLVLVLVLARSIEQSAILSQRVAEIIKQSDTLSLSIGEMSLSLGQYARSYKSKDLALYDKAFAALPDQERTMTALVRGTALEKPAQRYVKAIDAVVTLFGVTHTDVLAHREADVRRLIGAASTKRVANELEGAKGAVSAAAATTVLVVNTLGRRNIANIERMLLVTTSLGVIATILAALFLGLRTVRRLGILADNARRLSAGEAPLALIGNDEVAELDVVYRAMFERNVRAKARLEEAVRDYGSLAASIAAGDLTARVAVVGDGDELAQLGANLNHMAASLERLVDEIRAAASSLASATSQILAATSQQVSSATEEAAAVRQTAATVLEVRQTAEMAARKTRLVAELAQRVEQTAESGRQSVEESVQSSEGARTRMVALAERILAFSEQAQMIAEINATVAELAGQSNLLAVNAAIEAAKAGEASKGFAIVASEVKELGVRSKEATVQVRRIVTDIQKSAQSAVIAAEQGVRAAESGTTIVQRSGTAMETLTASIAEASEAAQQINASAEQQQIGMDQIALAMHSIEQASTQSVTATQQVERAAADLSLLAQKLSATIKGVRVS